MKHYHIRKGHHAPHWYQRLPRIYLCGKRTRFALLYCITPAMLQAVPGSINKIGGISAPPLSWVLRVVLHAIWQPLQYVYSWAITRGRKAIPMHFLKFHHHTSARLGWLVHTNGTADLYEYTYTNRQNHWRILRKNIQPGDTGTAPLPPLPRRWFTFVLRPYHGGPAPAKVRTIVPMKIE